MPIQQADARRCVAALCQHTPLSPAFLQQLASRYDSNIALCANLLHTRWTPITVIPRLQHMHKQTVGETLSADVCAAIARRHFVRPASAVRYVCRYIFHNWNIPVTSSSPSSSFPSPHTTTPTTQTTPTRATKPTVGVVVTTYGQNGVYARQCIASYYRCVPKDRYTLHVILYINEVTDDLTPTLTDVFPDLTIVHIQDQAKNGGLTGTWNQGIDWCLDPARACDLVVLSNDDLFVMSTFVHMLDEASACHPNDDVQSYFGPITNNPGPSLLNQWQHGLAPVPHKPTAHLYASQLRALNGFLMVFPSHVLRLNRYDGAHYFDPNKPFGGNEVEWAERFFAKSRMYRAVVVPQTFVYHIKLQQWRPRNDRKQTATHCSMHTCAYTINTGGYESLILLRDSSLDMPVFYFTDNEPMVIQAIAHGLVPMWVDITNGDTVRTQRVIKVAPHRFLPLQYTISVYVDGNCDIQKDRLEHWLSRMEQAREDNTNEGGDAVQLICWKHPLRTTIRSEAAVVKQYGLDYPKNIRSILAYLEELEYDKEKDVVLTETNMLIRRHHALRAFGDEWAVCIERCRRDQLSFDCLVHTHGVVVFRGEYSEKPLRLIRHTGRIGTVRQIVASR